ncbi:hypothetical protein M3Y94_01306900 [Aphelenchoides besseyi]|nr:hypothetical protein M3Y94_01306900 [Aphelenchoides besseyi]
MASEAQSSKSESTSKGEPTNAVETAASPENPVDPYASEEEVAGSQLKTQKKETEEVVEKVVQQVAEEESDKTPSASEKTVDSHESNDKDVTEDASKPQQPEEVKEVIKEVPLEAPPPPDTPLPPETPPPSEKVVDPYASAEDEVPEVQPKAQKTEAREAIEEEVVEEPLHESPPSSERVVDPYASTGEEVPETQPEIQKQEVEEVSTKNEQPIEEQKTVESRTNEDSRPVQPSIPKVIPRQNSFESDSRAETKPATSKHPPPYHRQYDEWNSNREDPWTAGASGIRFKNSKNNESNHSKSASSGISWSDKTQRVDNGMGGWGDDDNEVYHAKADENSNLSHHSNAENRSSNDVRSSYHGGEQTNFGPRRQERVCFNCQQPGHLSRFCPQKQANERHEQRNDQQNSWDTRQDNYRDSQNDYRGNQRNNYHDNQRDSQRYNQNDNQRDYHDNNRHDSQRHGYQSNQRDHYQSSNRSNYHDNQYGNHEEQRYGNQQNSSGDGWTQTFAPQQPLRDQRDEFRGHRESNGPRDRNNAQNQSSSTRPAHIPVQRTVDQIFQDDQENDIDERTLYDSDGGVIVMYGPDDMPVIDTWDEAELLPEVLENIKRAKYVRPRNIQRYALPLIWQGYDLKAQAETGSGKSAGFLVPIIDKLAREFKGKDSNERLHLVSALVVVPTRELAIQLSEQGRKLADGTGVRVNSAYGEYKIQNNVESIHLNGCDILVATLGRLLNFMRNKVIVYDKLKYFVLDEVDALLSYDSMEEIRQICAFEGFPTVSDRQTLCFSATMSPAVRQLADQFCKPKSPIIRNKIKDLNQRVTVEIVEVPFAERNQYLMDYLRGEAEKNDGVLPKKLIFVEKKRDVDELVEQLQELHIPIQAIHGERSQQQREEINRAFREGRIRALVATELFARGLDIADLGHVINVYMPSTREKFVHRIGRTGRTHCGVATTYFDPNHPDDREMAETIIEVLTKLKLDVPEFVRKAAEPTF